MLGLARPEAGMMAAMMWRAAYQSTPGEMKIMTSATNLLVF
jgi:hypothetical protein